MASIFGEYRISGRLQLWRFTTQAARRMHSTRVEVTTAQFRSLGWGSRSPDSGWASKEKKLNQLAEDQFLALDIPTRG